jgi:DNA replication protein DnaC
MKTLKETLKTLKLNHLGENISEYLKEAAAKDLSHQQFLKNIFEKEKESLFFKRRLARIQIAKMPNEYVIQTFPFEKQPHLNKKRLLEKFDSLDYIFKKTNMVFIGPTGSGKTGLATSFLVNAINKGYTGRFITFIDLMEELLRSQADRSGKKVIAKFAKFDCLVIDEMGYLEIDKTQVAMFFSLMQLRHKKRSTIITSNIGFEEWSKFLQNDHLSSALIDRLTDGGHVINMRQCESLREIPIQD